VKENDTKELGNYTFLNVVTSSFFIDFLKIIPRGFARFFHFRVELWNSLMPWIRILLSTDTDQTKLKLCTSYPQLISAIHTGIQG